jgi:cell division protein ZapE
MTSRLIAAWDARVAAGVLRDDAGQRAVVERLSLLAASLEARPQPGPLRGLLRRNPPPVPRGVYIWGGVGRGKSMLMDMFVACLRQTPRRRVHFHAFMQEVHAGLGAARQSGVTDPLAPVAANLAQGLRLLCLDEMEIADIADAMIVGRLFEALFAAGVTVVTTSNRPPGDLYADGLNRQRFVPFIALLEARLDIVRLDGPEDYRQAAGAGGARWFSPADARARAALDTVWDRAAGVPGTPYELVVHGRSVRLPQYHRGVARARFWDLCAVPLGPADFLAIAAALHLLILDDIPELSSQNYNEARRFVILIDALYESRVALYASAAVPPHRLYIEGEGAFEFARTASRLAEMQGAGWGRAR